MKPIYFIVLSLMLFTMGCNKNPLEKMFNQETMESDLKGLDESIGLQLADAIFVFTINEESMEGLTYGEIIEKSKGIEEKVRKENLPLLSVQVLKRKVYLFEEEMNLNLQISISNNLDNDINGFSGALNMVDEFGSEFFTLNIEKKGAIWGANSTDIQEVDVPIKSFNDITKKHILNNLEKIQFVWHLEEISH